MTEYFLGLNCAHDAAACLVSDEGIQAAVREERLTRVKHCEGFPARSIRYCLETAGLESLSQIAGATINQYPKMDCQFDLRAMGYRGPLHVNPSHHLLHALYARYFAGARDAMIVVLDGSGYSYGEYQRNGSPFLGDERADSDADEAESVFAVTDGVFELLRKRWGVWEASTPYFRFPSLGHVYSVACQHIFQEERAWVYAGKVMALAPYGRLDSCIPRLVSFRSGAFEFDLDWVYHVPSLQEDQAEYWHDEVRQDIAARVQHDLESTLLAFLRRLAEEHAPSVLCLTGGVAHNSVANGRVSRAGLFRETLFTPAADDAGTAIGGALYAFEDRRARPPRGGYRGDFHGRRYDGTEVHRVVHADPRIRAVRFEREANFAEDASERLAAGQFIAIFDGRSEFGARALAHRSILCDPRGDETKGRLNDRVKFREAYRPFGAMILEERLGDYFKMTGTSPHMMIVAEIVDAKRSAIPAVCHIDGTCRVQTVAGDYEGLAALVLSSFYEKTGLPLLLNTSFNVRGEPIVESPGDALECFCSTRLDALYMYPYRIEKHPVSWRLDDRAFLDFIPMLGAGLRLESSRNCRDGSWDEARFLLGSRTGRSRPLRAGDHDVLRHLDTRRTVADLVELVADGPELVATLKRLHSIGAICFGYAGDH